MSMQMKQNHQQILSQQMIQSVTILQMGAQELTEYMREVEMENPVADIKEPVISIKNDENINQAEWNYDIDEQNKIYYQYDKEDLDHNQELNNCAADNSERLADFLLLQLIGKHYPKRYQMIFEYIIESLDSKGFFSVPADEFLRLNHVDKDDFEKCVQIMRDLEPIGVCAENSLQCILKQLENRENCGKLEKDIVMNYLDLVGKNQLHIIGKKLGCSQQIIIDAVKKIKECNPYPAQGFSNSTQVNYVIPDVSVIKFTNSVEIQLNTKATPVIKINKEYSNMLNSKCSNELKEYLVEKINQVENIQSCIKKRNNTILELTKCIVEVQKEFFTVGNRSLKPLRLQEAAEMIGCHESTVSRAIKDKYLQCCYGVFPFSYFFPKKMGSEETSIATQQVKEAMMQIIMNEDKTKPYSDMEITQLMNEKNIQISRRTVTKYREGLNIPNGRERKEFR